MFDRIFADYLVECGKLTADNVKSIFSLESSKRVRLGVIAVSEKLMSIEQVNEVNQLQTVLDKRFGDIAIEKGYLNEEQVSRLLVLQGNAYLSFIQTVVDNGFLTMAETEEMLSKYQSDYSLTTSNIEDLKSCDVNRIIPIYLFSANEHGQALAGKVIRTMIRLVDFRSYIKKPVIVSEYQYQQMSAQAISGDYTMFTALSGPIDSLLNIAFAFAGEDNIEDTDDVLDALCEFVNCANGLYASDMSNRDVDIDMEAPLALNQPGVLKADAILCLPIVACGRQFDLLIVSNQEYSCN